MRVYVVGAHSVGKTTLVRYIAERHSLPIVAEVARAVLAERETALERLRTSVIEANKYQAEVFARQIEAEKDKRTFVSDRAFDNLAYAAEHATILPDLVGGPAFKEYVEWVRGGTVFFLRPSKALLRDDGVREKVDWDAIMRIDGMIKAFLELYRIPYVPISAASMQERAKIVDYVLNLVEQIVDPNISMR
jgi:nicotinamide riboside kinase